MPFLTRSFATFTSGAVSVIIDEFATFWRPSPARDRWSEHAGGGGNEPHVCHGAGCTICPFLAHLRTLDLARYYGGVVIDSLRSIPAAHTSVGYGQKVGSATFPIKLTPCEGGYRS